MNEVQLGTLAVRLKLDADNFTRNRAQATRDMKSMSKQLANEWGLTAKVIAASTGAMVTGIALVVRHMINEADKMGGMSSQIGVAVDQLSALKYAAEQSDVSFEVLTQSLTKLNVALGAVAGGNAENNPATLAFNALGIAAYDTSGKLKTADVVLSEVATKFASYKDGANKAAIATALFGEQGVKLTPMLNRGAAGIESLKKEAQALGIVIDADTARAAKEFNEVLARLQASGQGVALQLGKRLLPDMKLLAQAMETATRDGGTMDTVLDGVALTFKGIATGALVTAANITMMGGSIKSVVQFARDFVSVGLDQAMKNQAANALELAKTLQGMKAAVEGMWGGKNDGPIPSDLAKKAEDVPKALAPAMKAAEDLSAQFAAGRAAARAMLDDILSSPTEDVATKIAAVTQAAKDGTITFAELGRTMKQVMADQANLMDAVVAQATSAATSLFTDNKGVAIASALINTYMAITKALASAPPPYSYALAAATAAQGFAQVKAIRATNREYGGPVQAGQPYVVGEKRPELFVPSQSGHIVPNMPSGRGRDTSSGNTIMTVKGLSVREFFNGQQMRDLAEQMLAFQRNGGRVVLA